jgi:hypothetical protein
MMNRGTIATVFASIRRGLAVLWRGSNIGIGQVKPPRRSRGALVTFGILLNNCNDSRRMDVMVNQKHIAPLARAKTRPQLLFVSLPPGVQSNADIASYIADAVFADRLGPSDAA